MDRLGWAAGFSFSFLDLRIGFRTNSPESLEELKSRVLLPAWSPTGGAMVDHLFSIRVGRPVGRRGQRHKHVLYFGGNVVVGSTSWDRLLCVLEDTVHDLVSSVSMRRAFLRAGAVAWKGRALLLVGEEPLERSTLVLALVESGAEFLSDRFALLTRSGRVEAYPAPLQFKRGGNFTRIPACELGWRPRKRSLPVGLVISCAYAPRGPLRPRRLLGGKALMELAPHMVSTVHNPRLTLPALCELSQVPVYRTRRGEAGEVAPRILQLLRSGQP